jgi:hypothetical protein
LRSDPRVRQRGRLRRCVRACVRAVNRQRATFAPPHCNAPPPADPPCSKHTHTHTHTPTHTHTHRHTHTQTHTHTHTTHNTQHTTHNTHTHTHKHTHKQTDWWGLSVGRGPHPTRPTRNVPAENSIRRIRLQDVATCSTTRCNVQHNTLQRAGLEKYATDKVSPIGYKPFVQVSTPPPPHTRTHHCPARTLFRRGIRHSTQSALRFGRAYCIGCPLYVSRCPLSSPLAPFAPLSLHRGLTLEYSEVSRGPIAGCRCKG